MVSGGGAKPWRQKGTGRARAGSSRSPVWTGGGVVFGPQPRSYTFKVNRKEQRSALRSALSLHAGRGSLAVLDVSVFSQPSTRQADELLQDWGAPTPTLLVLDPEERDAALSFRNLKGVAVLTHQSVGVVDLVGAASLLASEAALDALSARATGEGGRAKKSRPSATAAKTEPAKADEEEKTEPAQADEEAKTEPAKADEEAS
jgi:large subunit ribosomal protein L4